LQARIEYAKSKFLQSAHLKTQVANECAQQVVEASLLIAVAFKEGRKLLLCGNGGSAADCGHMAAEFMSRLSKKMTRKALPAIDLTAFTPFITAHTNDVSFDDIFSRQVDGYGQEGDVLLAISTSGNSENVFWAIRKAQALKMLVVTLTGQNGKIGKEANVAIRVPSKETQRIQESHLAIEHVICELVENELFVKG
jgi:D-sedoheptulose 7-phosphate isomerase